MPASVCSLFQHSDSQLQQIDLKQIQQITQRMGWSGSPQVEQLTHKISEPQ